MYYDDNISADVFVVPDNIHNAKITTTEVKQVLESHFKANKSTGLSQLPLQCLKWIHSEALPTITDFLNKSAIE